MAEPAEDVAALAATLTQSIDEAADLAALEAARVAALGRNGRLTERMKALGTLSPDARKAMGAALNEARQALEARLGTRKTELEAAALKSRLERERQDPSLPAREAPIGRLHPITRTLEEIVAIFADLGFAVADGPDIEDDDHNFTALNFPPGHPARAMHDTFYLPGVAAAGEHLLLRTHTSPVQVRTMRRQPPPIRIIAPGRTYRSDYDQTHTPMFHQVEALVIDEATHMGHLKWTIETFVRAFFDVPDLPVRLRPSYFPFTEPSAEVDIGCRRGADTLELGPHGDWLEIMGCGMVHPNVLRACGLDPERYQGFAFGMGVERVAMLKYGIPDLRSFFESDLRFLKHYGFVPLDVPNLAAGLSA